MSELVDALLLSRANLLRHVEGLSDEQFRCRPTEGEWSIIEVLAHLIDVDYYWLGQALAIRDNPGHLFVHFDDEGWKLEHPDVRDAPIAEIQTNLDRSHKAVIAALTDLSDEELSRAGVHPRGTPYTVRDVFLRYPPHDQNHEQQILELLRSL